MFCKYIIISLSRRKMQRKQIQAADREAHGVWIIHIIQSFISNGSIFYLLFLKVFS